MNARNMMFFGPDVTQLELRNIHKYGDPNGPTWDWLYQRGVERGLTEDQIYQSIADGSLETSTVADRIATKQSQGGKN
jgi:hypothetical protein